MTLKRQPNFLEKAMADLGPERASENFTQRVLDGLADRRPSGSSGLSPRRVATLAALAAIGLTLGLWIRTHHTIQPAALEPNARLLRQEFESLQNEAEALRTLAAQTPPVLYLGGDGQIDLVLDLGQSGFEPKKLDIRPVAAGSRRSEPEDRRHD